MNKTLEHLNNLCRHIDLVRENTLLLGKKLIEEDQEELGIRLIERGYKHDISKFSGIEFRYLHSGPDVDSDDLQLAIEEHQSQNDHHPEFHSEGIEGMNKVQIAELCCDWLARAQEFGTSLRDWIDEKAVDKYNINKRGKQYKLIKEYVDLLLQDSFKR